MFCYYMVLIIEIPHLKLKGTQKKDGRTHSWPWNTSWDSSAIFHTLTERSLPPAVTQSSRLRLSSPVIASWCPKLQQITVKTFKTNSSVGQQDKLISDLVTHRVSTYAFSSTFHTFTERSWEALYSSWVPLLNERPWEGKDICCFIGGPRSDSIYTTVCISWKRETVPI